jgi:hypothetical protein
MRAGPRRRAQVALTSRHESGCGGAELSRLVFYAPRGDRPREGSRRARGPPADGELPAARRGRSAVRVNFVAGLAGRGLARALFASVAPRPGPSAALAAAHGARLTATATRSVGGYVAVARRGARGRLATLWARCANIGFPLARAPRRRLRATAIVREHPRRPGEEALALPARSAARVAESCSNWRVAPSSSRARRCAGALHREIGAAPGGPCSSGSSRAATHGRGTRTCCSRRLACSRRSRGALRHRQAGQPARGWSSAGRVRARAERAREAPRDRRARALPRPARRRGGRAPRPRRRRASGARARAVRPSGRRGLRGRQGRGRETGSAGLVELVEDRGTGLLVRPAIPRRWPARSRPCCSTRRCESASARRPARYAGEELTRSAHVRRMCAVYDDGPRRPGMNASERRGGSSRAPSGLSHPVGAYSRERYLALARRGPGGISG